MADEQRSESKKKREYIFEKKQPKRGSTAKTEMVPTITIKAPTVTTKASSEANGISVNGIRIDAEMARNAIIMSEIIGPPKAKRQRGR
ncbi:MAG: hypothetical protein FWE83_05280 [Oscillospiraceae bacterium]|nr:hypothetical protein [Oscillospiraceae bacterium]